MKIAINSSIGGFHLSDRACLWLVAKKDWELIDVSKEGWPDHKNHRIVYYESSHFDGLNDFCRNDLQQQEYTETDERTWEMDEGKYKTLGFWDLTFRTDPDLIECIEELGKDAYYPRGEIKVVEVPDGIEVEIHEGEAGYEWVAEKHRTWS